MSSCDLADEPALKSKAIDAIQDHLQAIRAQRPSIVSAADRSAKGARTISIILAAAREVFVDSGHAGLSLRKVAERAGVAVGNVNYYFASKRELLDAMLREILAD
ncbi:MAG: helix-turn-helix domain-containing protein [Parvularculaceae bacterium]